MHFWAPMFKWSLVIAGLGDLNRPIENVSIYQSSGEAMILILKILSFGSNGVNLVEVCYSNRTQELFPSWCQCLCRHDWAISIMENC